MPKDAEIVVYCGGPKCPQSRMAAEKLVKLGYENVRAYEGGLEEWKAAGFAVEKGVTASISDQRAGLALCVFFRKLVLGRERETDRTVLEKIS